MSSQQTFFLCPLFYSPVDQGFTQTIPIGCVLLDAEQTAVDFLKRELVVDEKASDAPDRAIVNELLAEIEDARDQGELDSMWRDTIQHCSTTVSRSDLQPVSVASMSAAQRILKQALEAND